MAVLNGSTLYYLHTDRLGTPQLATDSNEAVQWQASYDPFGQASVSGTITQNLRLPGQYFDLESGWNHNGFRDYAPGLGRYIEPDPIGRAGSGNNLYAYVYDNPANLIDPLGLCLLKSFVCGLYADLLGAAQGSNKTVGEGVGGSFGAGFVYGGSESLSIQVVADPNGNLGLAITNSGTVLGVFGASAMAGGQGLVSNSNSIFNLGGWSLSVNGSAGGGPAVGLEVSQSFSWTNLFDRSQWNQPAGPTTVTGTVGVGVGTKFAAGHLGYTLVPKSLSINCN